MYVHIYIYIIHIFCIYTQNKGLEGLGVLRLRAAGVRAWVLLSGCNPLSCQMPAGPCSDQRQCLQYLRNCQLCSLREGSRTKMYSLFHLHLTSPQGWRSYYQNPALIVTQTSSSLRKLGKFHVLFHFLTATVCQRLACDAENARHSTP